MISNTERFILVGIAIFSFAIFNLSDIIIDGSFGEIQKILKECPFEKFLRVFHLTIVFSCLGCLVSIFTIDKWNRQLRLGIFGLISALVFTLIPINGSYLIFLILSLIRGFTLPYLNIIPSVWLTELLSKYNYKLYIQIMHFLSSLGVSYLYVISNFTDEEINYPNIFQDNFNLNSKIFNNLTDQFKDDLKESISVGKIFDGIQRSKLWIPCLFVSFVQFLNCLVLIVAYFIEPNRKLEIDQLSNHKLDDKPKDDKLDDKPKDDKLDDKPKDDKPEPKPDPEPVPKPEDKDKIYENAKKYLKPWYTIVFSILICLILIFQIANQMNIQNNLIHYLIELDWNVKEILNCSLIMGQFYLIGRFLNIFLTIFLSSQSILFINYLLIILGNVLFSTLSGTNRTHIYITVALISMGFTNILPIMIGLVQERINLTYKKMSIIYFVEYVTPIASAFIIYNYVHIEDSDRHYFTAINIVTCSASSIFLTILIILEKLRISKKI